MAFSTPDYASIRDGILRDISNQLPGAAVNSDSDWYIWANAMGAAIEGLYQHQQWIARQRLPDTADADDLDRWAIFVGGRLSSTIAMGSVQFSGTSGTVIPTATQIMGDNGLIYATTASGTIGMGGISGSITVAAQIAGSQSNTSVAITGQLVAPITGVTGITFTSALTGGADTEGDDALRSRILTRIRNTPQGGNVEDWRTWALSVPGVAAAWIFPLRRGAGTVDIAIRTDSITVATSGFLATVSNAIGSKRPVPSDFTVLYPSPISIDITATLSMATGYTTTSAAAVIGVGIANYFASLAPGDTIRKSQIEAIISEAPGVIDRYVSAPSGNISMLVDSTHVQIGVLGALTLS